jgi:hypothetical protein
MLKGLTLNGERHGQGTYTFQDGKTYVGTWHHGLRHGQGALTFPNGDTYVERVAEFNWRSLRPPIFPLVSVSILCVDLFASSSFDFL